jgi:hypothetical protein
MSDGCTWSPILGRFVWTSMVCTTTPTVLANARRWGLEGVRREFLEYMSRTEIRTPVQLIGWLRSTAADMASKRMIPRERVSQDVALLTKYAHLADYVQ